MPFIPHERILRYEEIVYIAEVMASMGIKKIRITGGEPFVRKGVCDLVSMLNEVKGIEHVVISTNGTLIASYLSDLRDSGLHYINISLDAIDHDIYRNITQSDISPEVVIDAIKSAKDMGFHIKINTVITAKNLNNSKKLLELARNLDVEIRFIELMPMAISQEQWQRDFISARRLMAYLGIPFSSISRHKGPYDGPSVKILNGSKDFAVGIIAPITMPFCDGCNRIRLEAHGRLRPCLSLPISRDLMPYLNDPATLEKVLKDTIYNKPRRHAFNNAEVNKSMGMNRTGG